MTVALFQSVLKTNEGETVWSTLKQKVVEAAEVPMHVATGWFESAQDAFDAHELATLEAENAKLEAQIATEQAKLDGRTKAAKELKAKNAPVIDQGNADAASVAEQATAAAPQSSTQTEAPTESAVSAQPDVSAPDAPAA